MKINMEDRKYKYQVWADSTSTTLASEEQINDLKLKGLIEEDAKLIHTFEAATGEEASSIYNLRMGFEPYKPAGKPELCPNNCGAYYYPEGSGQCPYCGDIC
jgi:hypothetical protein